MHHRNPSVKGGIVFTVGGAIAAYAITPHHNEEHALHLEPPVGLPTSSPSYEGTTFPGSGSFRVPSGGDGETYTI
jgi:hypothetical protein